MAYEAHELSGSELTGSDESYTASTQSFDTLDELLSRFTLEFKPEYTLKLRNRCAIARRIAARRRPSPR